MKTSFAVAALVAASFALATSASAHQLDRSHVAPTTTSQSFNAASAQNDFGSHDGRFVIATTGDATGGPSGGPNQNGG